MRYLPTGGTYPDFQVDKWECTLAGRPFRGALMVREWLPRLPRIRKPEPHQAFMNGLRILHEHRRACHYPTV